MQELQLIRNELRYIKAHDKEIREAHLDELIQENVSNNPGSTYAGELKRLKHIESQRASAARIKKSSLKRKKEGISRVMIPAITEYTSAYDQNKYKDIDVIWKRLQKLNGKDVEHWEEVSDQDLVEKLSLNCMKKHFGQANGSILTSSKWNQRLVDPKFINLIREGNFQCIENECEAVQEYFKAMTTHSCDKKLEQFTYTLDEWSHHIKSVKERTTTSPNGRHYGHFKVLLQKEPQIFKNIFDVMNIAMGEGIILTRWKKTVTVLIPKDEGVPKIHRLRPLHIVEPEVNAIAKALWAKKLMRIAESSNNMTDNQYGGRKNRQAQSAVFNKILYYDINRLSMKEAQYDDIDMRSNYDRELVRLVTAEAQIKLGLHQNDAKFMVDFVESQQWYVKTGFGISNECYRFEQSNPMFGLGQGIAWSGPGWLMSSDTIAKSKSRHCLGMVYESPMSTLTVKKMKICSSTILDVDAM